MEIGIADSISLLDFKSDRNQRTNTDFSFDPELNIAKQNYVILLFTGLRGSDGLKKLDISNIDNGFIKIKTSQKKNSFSLYFTRLNAKFAHVSCQLWKKLVSD